MEYEQILHQQIKNAVAYRQSKNLKEAVRNSLQGLSNHDSFRGREIHDLLVTSTYVIVGQAEEKKKLLNDVLECCFRASVSFVIFCH